MSILEGFAEVFAAKGRHSRRGSVIRRMADALLPQDCLLCGAAADPDLLCDACDDSLPRLPASRCPVCALPTPDNATCGACLKKTPHFDATLACFRYAFPVDRLVQALKYHHRLAVAGFFAETLSMTARQGFAPHAERIDLVLALPLAPRRLRERGFNQALEIARPLTRKLGLPLALSDVTHVLDNASQASLPWKERQRNIRGAFECARDLEGKSIVVIDDVMTTGATLDEFARTLKKHGAARVSNWVVARALKD